ncbi:DUF418 domain-containing protein [Corynebacterium tuscaniense]|uniref:DUF418 domain-containing protein n=1 Tax=Corynebacterium tuscaniense TaxID=302449 RepID=UPI00123C6B77|nr:DUF418 domain-containing protein [Corynebacterium tuscaniense]KAA8744806.1 DUF418 domain-containing protein [Corynebacterium tuscaniense]
MTLNASSANSTSTGPRLLSLDVVRGIAVCGIAFVNVTQMWNMFPESARDTQAWTWLNFLANERFFPVFTFLFGIGFAMITRSARRRGRVEWQIMLRRLIPLLLLGLVHGIFQPGEALGPYAIGGLVFLFPLTFLPLEKRRGIALALGVILTLVGAYFGGVLLIPGLLLLGFAVSEWRVPEKLDENPKPAALALPVLILFTAIASYVQYLYRDQAGFSPHSSIAGFLFAATWVAAVVVLVRTPLRQGFEVVFAPLGRMALTNYIGATVILLASRPLLGIPAEQGSATNASFLTAWGVVLVMLTAQMIFSALWLKRFGQGPLEKLWRKITWGTGFHMSS